jgi:ethanolamine ammonia-lyase small subunit
MARDAVHVSLDAQAITTQLEAAGLQFIQVHSTAVDRATYLRRPDLGRQLGAESRDVLGAFESEINAEIIFIIADGLSAIAPQRYAVPVIIAALDLLQGWQIGPVILAEQARVALGDEVGAILRAEITVMLIGERPGLSAPDSLGIYLTYEPAIGRTDAERNCISNIRLEGMSPDQAAKTLAYLLVNARSMKLSGVALKDESCRSNSSLQDGAEPLAQKQIKAAP